MKESLQLIKVSQVNNPILIISGKTASGKDTVMLELLTRFPGFKRVVTTTSRNLRTGEKQGVDYNFVSKQDFKQKAERGDFIEFVEYAGSLYGTEKAQILSNLNGGLIWRIDPSRAGQIRDLIKSSFEPVKAEEILRRILVIYLTVDDTVVLERLKERNLGSQEISRRMEEDNRFWREYQDKYDFVVENVPGRLSKTIDKVVKILENHRS